jgi:hypothetical protein
MKTLHVFNRIASTEGTPMSHLARTALIILAGLIALAALIVIGLRIKPRTAPPADLGPAHDLGTVPLPSDLPAPVRRHYEAAFGERRASTTGRWRSAGLASR